VFWGLEPPLADRIEWAIGVLASLTANINRDSKRKPDPFVAQDFMIQWEKHLVEAEEEAPPGMTPEEIIGAFDRLIAQQHTRQ
jgi:hypothetical protein